MSARLRLAICENAPELVAGGEAWNGLCRRVKALSPDRLLMNELPFGPWISSWPVFRQEEWDRSVMLHASGLRSLGELGARAVAITHPRLDGQRRVNEGADANAANLDISCRRFGTLKMLVR